MPKISLSHCGALIVFCLSIISACDQPTPAVKNTQPPMLAVYTQLIIP
ncbi:MAG TPA: hypothetical protein PKZ52_07835 [Cellvibrionaceae bacterium]|nr:hypothetical protein [Cellvibrionaceae bacterium]